MVIKALFRAIIVRNNMKCYRVFTFGGVSMDATVAPSRTAFPGRPQEADRFHVEGLGE